MRPRRSRLGVKVPVVLRDGVRVEKAVDLLELGRPREVLVNPRRVDRAVDDDVGDVNVLPTGVGMRTTRSSSLFFRTTVASTSSMRCFSR